MAWGTPTKPGGVHVEEGFTALASVRGSSGLWGVLVAAGGATFQVPSPAAGLEPRVNQWGPCRNCGRAWGTGPPTFPHHPESYFKKLHVSSGGTSRSQLCRP